MRFALTLPLLLAACAQGASTPLSTRPPGLDIAQVAMDHGAPETALHVAQTVLATNPRNVSALIAQANAQAALNEREQATQSFQQALAHAPDDPEAILGLGRLELANDPAAAAAILARAAASAPQNVAVQVDLGIADDLLGQHGAAQSHYRAALALEPGRVAASVNLGLSLALSGSTQKALAILRPLAATSDASSRTRHDLAAALVLAGDTEEAGMVLRADLPMSQAMAAVAGFQLLKTNR